jgi:Heterokaryon incompatibility protein (HET)
MSSQPFKQEPLDTSKQEIRLLRILPTRNAPKGEISCILKHFDLDDICANGISEEGDERQWSLDDVFGARLRELSGQYTYQALSYNWGEDKKMDIVINGKIFQVRENLYHFLDECQRTPLIYNYVWIDQICINQETVCERNHQVQLMGRIFGSAIQVIAWLGPLSGDLAETAFRFVKDENHHGPCSGSDPKQPRLVEDSRLLTKSMCALFGRPYWTRLWIVQEALLAKDLIFCLGHICAPSARLILFCRTQIRWFRDRSNDRLDNPSRNFVVPKAVCELLFATEYRAPTGTLHATSQSLALTTRQNDLPDKTHALEHFSLSQLIENFSDLDCADPRDKVFGLLGLANPKERIIIDYRMSCTELLRALLNHVHPLERLEVLGKRMRISPNTINQALHLPGQVRDTIARAYGRAPSLHMRKREKSSAMYQYHGETMDSLHELLEHVEISHKEVTISRSTRPEADDFPETPYDGFW